MTLKWFLAVALTLLSLTTPGGGVNVVSPSDSLQSDVEVHDENLGPVQLVFACASQTSQLKQLFTPELIADLRQLKAGVALSTADFTVERAEVVRELNAAGIPLTAVITLPGSQGYYANADNAPQVVARFAQFDKWNIDNGLRWEAVGLDIEPSLGDFGDIAHHKLRFAFIALARLFQSSRVYRSRRMYADLIRQMQAHEYFVETYQLPFLVEEREAHSTFLERVLGLVDVRGNQEALMLYTSFNPALGTAMIWSYGPNAQSIAVGVVVQGTQSYPKQKFAPLSWEDLSQDLIVAHHFSRVVGIYSLEGCISQGYISRLKTLDWKQPVVIRATAIRKTARTRRFVYRLLWIARFLPHFVAIFFLITVWMAWAILRRFIRKRAAAATSKSLLSST